MNICISIEMQLSIVLKQKAIETNENENAKLQHWKSKIPDQTSAERENKVAYAPAHAHALTAIHSFTN